jgi:hypothetical protein
MTAGRGVAPALGVVGIVSLIVTAVFLVSSSAPPSLAQTASSSSSQPGQSPCTYYVYKTGTDYYAQNCSTSLIAYGGPGNTGGATGTSFVSVMDHLASMNDVQIVLAAGTFTASGSIQETGTGVTITGAGMESTIVKVGSTSPAFTTTGTNVQFSYFAINSGVKANTGDAIYVSSGQGISIDHMMFGGYGGGPEALYGNGIVIVHGFHQSITNSIFEVIVNHDGIIYGGATSGPEGLEVIGNDFSDVNGSAMIDVAPYSGFVTIDGNTLDTGLIGIELSNQGRIGVVNNEISAMQQYAIQGSPVNSVISDNRFNDDGTATNPGQGAYYYFLYFPGGNSVSVTGNSFYTDPGQPEANYFLLIGSGGTFANSTITDNTFGSPPQTASGQAIQMGSSVVSVVIADNQGGN